MSEALRPLRLLVRRESKKFRLSSFCLICHSLTFKEYIFVYMDTNEILSKLAYLEKLEREFKEAHSNLSPSDIFDFYKKNNWPIVA